MEIASNITYRIVCTLIRNYKWTERQVLKLFTGPIERKAIVIAESIGTRLHFVKDDHEKVTWSEEEDQELLARIGNKYDRVIHLRIKDKKEFFTRITNEGSMGFGECYMDGLWSCVGGDDELMEFATRFMQNDLLNLYMNPWNRFLNHLELLQFNLQTKTKARDVVDKHYDLGNDLYELMLDPVYLQYTCGYYGGGATTLEQAQEDKLDLIARKLELKKGMKLLDVG